MAMTKTGMWVCRLAKSSRERDAKAVIGMGGGAEGSFGMVCGGSGVVDLK